MERVSDEDLDHTIKTWENDIGDDYTDQYVYPLLCELKERRETDRPQMRIWFVAAKPAVEKAWCEKMFWDHAAAVLCCKVLNQSDPSWRVYEALISVLGRLETPKIVDK